MFNFCLYNSSLQRVMNDLKKKGNDIDRVSDLSLDLQNLLDVRLDYNSSHKCAIRYII